MTISFIIPVYNRAAVVGRCLDSILANDHDLIKEIVVVDDGSTDDSAQVVQCYVDQYPGLIHLVKLEINSGVSAARNKGLEQVTGDYVWFVDSDDFVAKDALAHLCRTMAEERPDLFRFSWERLDPSEIPKDFDMGVAGCNAPIRRYSLLAVAIEEVEYLNSISLLWNAIYRKEITASVRFKIFPNGEDRLYATECLLKSDKIFVQEGARLYGYVVGHASASSEKTERMFMSYVGVTLALMEAYEESGLPENLKQHRYERESVSFFSRLLSVSGIASLSDSAWHAWRHGYRQIFVDNRRRPWHLRIWSRFALASESRFLLFFGYWLYGKWKGALRRIRFWKKFHGTADERFC